jgi:hypothetical protein
VGAVAPVPVPTVDPVTTVTPAVVPVVGFVVPTVAATVVWASAEAPMHSAKAVSTRAMGLRKFFMI